MLEPRVRITAKKEPRSKLTVDLLHKLMTSLWKLLDRNLGTELGVELGRPAKTAFRKRLGTRNSTWKGDKKIGWVL